MPVQHSPPARQANSQARTKSVPTATPRAPHNATLAVPQLRAHLERGPIMEGVAPYNLSMKINIFFRICWFFFCNAKDLLEKSW
ncbi:hypothetical protein O181_056015 [Austropuccinia psidii MF-1]|uniref:Uncharacterized protein n=1 Tax=Austropuccinia psidii MF-1 TaxID=1389203 RepID=A0A9Q3E5E3_9BASI|nr:hypothetical protein [Austropuccinia psidii MF-1]